ncbi:MAG: riboflavin synthase [Saprospirales bacterium]|nr:MAG: riboflavin synthase [Saprospirales bacterium]
MFTGIVRHIGKVAEITDLGTSKKIKLTADLSKNLQVDQSVCHDGVCLTVEETSPESYSVTAVKETLDKSNLRSWKVGTRVNLEISATPTTLLDGHIVQGHVDDVAKLLKIEDLDGSWYFTFQLPKPGKSLVVPKGSIAVNGVSLTIADLKEDTFTVAIIPYTYENTGFKDLEEGQLVNLEYDVIGKYVQRQMGAAVDA